MGVQSYRAIGSSEPSRRAGGMAWGRAAAWVVLAISVGGLVAAAAWQPPAPPPAPAAPPVVPPTSPGQAPSPAEGERAQPAGKKALPRPAAVRRHGVAEPIPKPAGAIRIASYNVENLFTDKDPGASADSGTKPLKPAEETANAAKAIRAIDADVVALQEIGSLESLKAFRDQYLSDLGYAHLSAIDAGDGRGIEQAVLSRFPIKDEKNWPGMVVGGTHPDTWGREKNENAGQPIKFARSPLRVTIEAPGKSADEPFRLTLFVVHFKSGGPGNYWRVREAQKTGEMVKEFEKANPGARVAVLGDFNSQPGDPPVQALIDAGLVDAMKDRTPRDPKWMTHTSNRVIDLIMMNAALSGHAIKETRFVLGTPTRAEGVDWRTTANPEGWASDHYPVVVDFSLTPPPAAPATLSPGAAPASAPATKPSR